MLALAAAMSLAMANRPTIPQFRPKPCADAAVAKRARCGTVTVPEDRARPGGRRIDLNLIVIPAAAPKPGAAPLFDLEGGPGLADTKNTAFYLDEGSAYSAHRDVVLLDQRGTGESNPLDCPEFDAADRDLQPMYPPAAVTTCRARLARSAALGLYTTAEAVADLDDVRQALHYPRIDLSALSYGTTVALRYIAEKPDRVRSAVLLSAAPPSAMPPRNHGPAAQAALERLFADCAADAACNRAYPRLKDELTKALKRLRDHGRIVPQVAMERLRTKLYSPAGARELPWVIRRLAEGDEGVLASANDRTGWNFFEGMYLGITCAESLAWFDVAQASAKARGTVFGDYRLARQAAACRLWPTRRASEDFFAPIRSDVPVLFLSGGRDPVTPADWAAGVARGFPNGRHLVMPWAGHVFDGLSGVDTCFDPLVLRFYETADARAIDGACLATMQPPPFKLPASP